MNQRAGLELNYPVWGPEKSGQMSWANREKPGSYERGIKIKDFSTISCIAPVLHVRTHWLV